MKKIITVLLVLFIAGITLLMGCSTVGSNSEGSGKATTENIDDKQNKETELRQIMSIEKFENLLKEQPLCVIKTECVVQDEQNKTLYPDMMQAVIKNNSTKEIKNAVVAFAAWDENNLPVKIKGQFDVSGDYIREIDYDDVNLVAGATFGEDKGCRLNKDCKIKSLKAIVISFETFDGETWKNPYYEAFRLLYEGKKFSNDMTVEVEIVENTFPINKSPQDKPQREPDMTAAELESKLSTQPITIVKTKYLVQDEQHKSLYPDMLQAVIKNNTSKEIKNAIVAFAAWDENNLPVKIEGQFDVGSGSYIKKVDYGDVNLVAGATFGEDKGYEINENCKIKSFKAIVVSYEAFDGESWENPYYEAFCSLYEGKKLS